MHPLNTHQRRRLLAACLRLERQLRRDHSDQRLAERRRLARLMRGGRPWDTTTL